MGKGKVMEAMNRAIELSSQEIFKTDDGTSNKHDNSTFNPVGITRLVELIEYLKDCKVTGYND